MSSAVVTEPLVAATRPTPEEPLYEVVNGQRVELPPMSIYASWIASRLQVRMGAFADEHEFGTVVTEALFILNVEHDVRRRPDVAFVSAERWPLDRPIPPTGDWEVVPDLAVEVVSPNELFKDVVAKVREYFEAGAREVWVILPEERLVYVYTSPTEVRTLTNDAELQSPSLLTGWRLPVASLFTRQAAAQPAS